jgi:hypothetical protein
MNVSNIMLDFQQHMRKINKKSAFMNAVVRSLTKLVTRYVRGVIVEIFCQIRFFK